MHPMAVMKITGRGLLTIGFLVIALWGCILMESSVVHDAQLVKARSLRELRELRLRRPMLPAAQHLTPSLARPAAG